MDQETETQQAVESLVKNTNRVLVSYAAEFRRINSNLVACHVAMEKQAHTIIELRDVVDVQQQAIAKLLARVFPDEAATVMSRIRTH